MTINLMKSLILLFLIHIISSEEIPISSFEQIDVPIGEYNYSYQFIESNIPAGKDGYFYFKFKIATNIQLNLIEENNNKTKVEIDNEYWLYYNISNLNSQKYIFQIINKNQNLNVSIIFIDGTKEINLSLEQYINLNFDSHSVINRPPMPIIFNLNILEEEEGFYYFKETEKNGKLYDANYLLYYCEIEENKECDFIGFQSLFFEKNKKYKIKQNIYKYNEKFYFTLFSIVKEIEFDLIRYTQQGNQNYRYYLINVENIENNNAFYIHSNTDFYGGFMNDNYKNRLPSYIDSISFSSYYKGFVNINKNNYNYNYFILKIKDNYNNIIIYFYKDIYEIKSDMHFIVGKGEKAIIKIDGDSFNIKKSCLVSTNKNMIIIDSNFDPNSNHNLQNLFCFNSLYKIYIYVDTKEKSSFKYFTYETKYNTYSLFNFVSNDNLTNYFNISGTDSMFIRGISSSSRYIFNSTYFFDIEEQYYLYFKKYYGFMDVYKYNQELDIFSNFTQFFEFSHSYDNENEYKLINNELIILNGFQFYTFSINYNSLFDFYIQKVEDSEDIKINSEMFKFNNLVKLLNANKTYHLKFTADHLIKLDNKFIDAQITFIDKENKEYYLNENQRIIEHLEGDDIIVISNKKALIYFYKKIPNYNKEGTIIFDREQKRKNMKFTIQNIKNENISISIVKDFGFKGYYPLISSKYWDKVITKNNNSATIYIDNYFDKSDYKIYETEEEDYIIYIFDSLDENNYPIFNYQNYKIDNIEYIDNLLTPGNKYNFEVIKGGANGSIILNLNEKYEIKYQFIMCKSKKIEFKIENSNGYFEIEDYPYEDIFKENNYIIFGLNNYETLAHSFKSDNEFLFLYNTDSPNYGNYLNDYDIFTPLIEQIDKNKLIIKFEVPYYGMNRFYIIIAIKDDLNNINSFSDVCYVAKLMTQNKNNIILKTIYEEGYNILRMKITTVDISKLNPKENDDIIMTIIDENLFSDSMIEFLKPVEFKLEKKYAINIEPEKEIKFNLINRYSFKFDYMQENNDEQSLIFNSNSIDRFYIIIYSFESEKIEISEYERSNGNIFKLQKSGTYYIDLYTDYTGLSADETFTIHITGNIIDTIDLSKKIYYNNIKIISPINPNPSIYKVNNLKKDTLVYFSYDARTNPFEICNENIEGKCSKNIGFYNFLKDYNYTINVNFDSEYGYRYVFNSYLFFPIFEDTLEYIQNGYYTSSLPKIYIINYVETEILYCMVENTNNKMIITQTKEEEITLDNLINIKFTILAGQFTTLNPINGYKNGLVIIIPVLSENPSKIIISNDYITYNKPGKYIFCSGKNAIINYYTHYYDIEDEEESEYFSNPLDLYNDLSIIASSIKNMKIIYDYEEKVYKDFIVQNYFKYPIYLGETEINTTLSFKSYEPRYSFFIAADNTIFNLYWAKLDEIFRISASFKIIDMNNLRFVVNSDMHTFYEFFNLYFYDMKGNKNFYIKQYFGNTELYEYNPELIKDNDFSILTKPRDITIQNKTSLLNKIVKLENNKLIFGYLGQNSLLDIYWDVDNNSTEIKLSYLQARLFKNTAKFLKKDIEYTIEFEADHLAKLEPGFNAEVSIYNDEGKNIVLTPENPTGKFEGNNFKVRSNNDAMVYFYGKIMEGLNQLEIDPKQIGKNFELKTDDYINYYISFSFKGYSPTEILSTSYNLNFLKEGGNIYLENIYDKIKTKLVKGENLYLYHISAGKLDIKYSPNLNHKNNIYTFLTIPADSADKTLIINNINKEKIRYQIHFCESPNIIEMYYQDSESSEETILEFNNETRFIDHNIYIRGNKFRFKSSNDFVFSYSFFDYTDNKFNSSERFNNEREVLDNLTIENISKKYPDDNTSDIFTIKFKPNYRKSSTRYIVVIAPNEGTNSLDNFKNPCYVTKLATNNNKGTKNINMVDIGENDSIEFDVDIHDILGKTDKYLINIISQELRFEKKINFYQPEIFTYRECYDNCDEDGDEEEEIEIEEEKEEEEKEEEEKEEKEKKEEEKKEEENEEENIEEEEENKDDSNGHNEKEEKSDGFPLIYSIFIGVSAFIVILLVIFFIIRYKRIKSKDIDLNIEAKDLSNEELMQDM